MKKLKDNIAKAKAELKEIMTAIKSKNKDAINAEITEALNFAKNKLAKLQE